VTDGPTDS